MLRLKRDVTKTIEGGSAIWRPDPAVRSPSYRFECKYLVHPKLVHAIREFIRPFVRLDPFAARSDGQHYPTCSLYLDTPDLYLCRQTLDGEKNRFKMRIRSYSDDLEAPLFFEIKRRVDGVVSKCRSRLSRSEGMDLLSRRKLPGRVLPFIEQNDLQQFSLLATLTGVGPVMRVKYLREAYESIGAEAVRITLDQDLCHSVTLDHDMSHDGAGWHSTPVSGTILEIKFARRFPTWVGTLVQIFQLQRTSLAKYCMSMINAVDNGRFRAAMSSGLRIR